MGLFVDELCSSIVVTHMLYKTALVIAVMRWVLSWAIRLRNRASNDEDAATPTTTSLFRPEDLPFPSPPIPCSSSSSSSCSQCCASNQLIRDSLILTTFGEFSDRLPDCRWDSCAVCLTQFGARDEVTELRNCCHVFHRECLDKWLDHDGQSQSHHDSSSLSSSLHQSKTCPLCRSPFLTESQAQSLSLSLDSSPSQPSWAVERLLYLFGDDLLL